MSIAIFPFIVSGLVRIGTFGTGVEGSRYAWRAANRLAHGTPFAPVLSGGEVVAKSLLRELGPLDPFRLLDSEEGLLAPITHALAGPGVMRDLRKAEKLTRSARSLGASDGTSSESIYQDARRRFSQLSKRFGDRAIQAHNVSPDCPEALRLADQCLALAEMSQDPPRDPRQVLTEDMPPSMASALTDVIDGCNRAEEPDLALLESRLLEASDPVAGKKPCCDACAKKTGPCASGACGVSASGHDHDDAADHGGDSEDGMPSNLMLFGPSGEEEADLSLDDDDEISLDDDGLGDLEGIAGGLLSKKSCSTGSCRG